MRRRRGFTLIELLVVIAVIALLIGILLPALGKSRSSAKQLKCSVNARSVAMGVVSYGSDYKLFFPPHYVYGADETSMDWKLSEQLINNPHPITGYVHWSYALFNTGNVNESSFTCPEMPKGGAPRTCPGSDPEDWEPNQINDSGGPIGQDPPRDRQVKRIGYVGNHALFPRNKFIVSEGARLNRLVTSAMVDGSARGGAGTILTTEIFSNGKDWNGITAGGKIKSHRPLTPFLTPTGNVYTADPNSPNPQFYYPAVSDIMQPSEVPAGAIDDDSGVPLLNLMGRTHKGKQDSKSGGAANCAFADGHVALMTVLETIEKKSWGTRFYTLTGNNRVSAAPGGPPID